MKLKDALEWMLIETAPVALASKYGQSAQEAIRKHLENIDYADMALEDIGAKVEREVAIFRKNLKVGHDVKFKLNSGIWSGVVSNTAGTKVFIIGYGWIERDQLYPIDFKYTIK